METELSSTPLPQGLLHGPFGEHVLGGDMGFQGTLKQMQGLFEHLLPKPLPLLKPPVPVVFIHLCICLPTQTSIHLPVRSPTNYPPKQVAAVFSNSAQRSSEPTADW